MTCRLDLGLRPCSSDARRASFCAIVCHRGLMFCSQCQHLVLHYLVWAWEGTYLRNEPVKVKMIFCFFYGHKFVLHCAMWCCCRTFWSSCQWQLFSLLSHRCAWQKLSNQLFGSWKLAVANKKSFTGQMRRLWFLRSTSFIEMVGFTKPFSAWSVVDTLRVNEPLP